MKLQARLHCFHDSLRHGGEPGTPLFKNPEKYKITYIDKDFSKYYQIYGDKKSGYVFETEDMDLDKLRFYRDYLVSGIADACPWAIDDAENR